jgi:glutamate/tyrosine decarboxylase-like PLP-dependent enzyme
VTLNIVCFRYTAPGLDAAATNALNAAIAVDLQERGIAVPSTTHVDGRLALRMNVMNHRTTPADLDATLDAVLTSGAALR